MAMGIASVAELVEKQGLPASVHTERVVLGAMQVDAVALREGLEMLSESAFTLDSHRRIFAAMGRMGAAGTPVDLTTLLREMEKRSEVQAVGGPSYLMGLTENLPRHLAISHYAQILRDKAARRDLYTLLQEFELRALSPEEPAVVVIADLVQAAQTTEILSSGARYGRLADAVPAVLAEMIRQRDRAEGLLGLPTGIATVDLATTGYRNGELTYIGAAPGRGKSSVLLQGIYAAASEGIPCGLISLEMRCDQLIRRLALMATNLRPHEMRDAKKLGVADFQYAMQAVEKLGELPVYACDQDWLRPHEIASMARRMVLVDGVRILYVDFVQIVQETGRTQKEAIDKISAALRGIAKNLNIPVVVASQLARRDADVNRVPTLQDLRESGNLEQDAHNVFLLYRPVDRSTSDFTGEDQFIIAKSREGTPGAIPVAYDTRSLTYKPREATHA